MLLLARRGHLALRRRDATMIGGLGASKVGDLLVLDDNLGESACYLDLVLAYR